jgi:HEAT repeat protein
MCANGIISVSIALVTLWVCLGALVATAGLSLLVRLASSLRERRVTRYEQRMRGPLAAFAAGVGDEPPPPRSALERRLLQRDLLALRPKLKGEAAAAVDELVGASRLLDGALRDLHSRSVLVQVRAADALGTIGGPDAVPYLVEQLDAPDRRVRFAAARALANLGAGGATPKVLTALADAGHRAEDVAEVLSRLGGSAVPALRERLRDGHSAQERRLAAAVLGELRALEAAGELRAALSDPDPQVAAAAAAAVGRLCDVSALPALLRILGESDAPALREAAADALGAIDDPAAGPALIRALDAPEWGVRDAAARALCALGDAGVQQLAATLDAVSDRGLAHAAGVLDMGDQLAPVIARAGLGDMGLHRLVGRIATVGVRARLTELARDAGPLRSYAQRVLAETAAEAHAATT